MNEQDVLILDQITREIQLHIYEIHELPDVSKINLLQIIKNIRLGAIQELQKQLPEKMKNAPVRPFGDSNAQGFNKAIDQVQSIFTKYIKGE